MYHDFGQPTASVFRVEEVYSSMFKIGHKVSAKPWYQSRQRHIPDNRNVNTHHLDNIETHHPSSSQIRKKQPNYSEEFLDLSTFL
jgi:hypothetical protein